MKNLINRTATLALVIFLAGCSGGAPKGVYQNADGTASVEFLGDGRASLSLSGLGGACTYSQSGKAITLVCDGESVPFTLESDGSLTGPQDSYFARLTKKG